ncbi:hypothetical protein [Kingella potus]|uniref:hypothetical protein n=1 Tax=Kingella potus TaxID=265175 RepID=UPI001FD0F11B|nr:hypothetical protein [Kingella potus]UOP01294.1 hypothetical protein LVJ84_03305 [Kingella potus]
MSPKGDARTPIVCRPSEICHAVLLSQYPIFRRPVLYSDSHESKVGCVAQRRRTRSPSFAGRLKSAMPFCLANILFSDGLLLFQSI